LAAFAATGTTTGTDAASPPDLPQDVLKMAMQAMQDPNFQPPPAVNLNAAGQAEVRCAPSWRWKTPQGLPLRAPLLSLTGHDCPQLNTGIFLL